MSRRKSPPLMDVTDDLPIEVQKGQVLRFNQGGDIISLKIVRITKAGRIMAKYVDTYDKEALQEMTREAETAEAIAAIRAKGSK